MTKIINITEDDGLHKKTLVAMEEAEFKNFTKFLEFTNEVKMGIHLSRFGVDVDLLKDTRETIIDSMRGK